MRIGNKLTDCCEVKQTLGRGRKGIKRVPLLEGLTLDQFSHVPAAFGLNPAVSPLLGSGGHKTMAKHPCNRFNTTRDMCAGKAFETGDLQFACGILPELEPELRKIDPAVRLKMLSQCPTAGARGSKTRNTPSRCKKFRRHSKSRSRMPRLFACSAKSNPIGVPDRG